MRRAGLFFASLAFVTIGSQNVDGLQWRCRELHLDDQASLYDALGTASSVQQPRDLLVELALPVRGNTTLRSRTRLVERPRPRWR
jgi:hypothetical protein